ncbi:HIT domain-containing protein [bacterium AH-315-J21]|nr:HIT domain-containing protein [bacterium AH-315-J21]
MSADCIFCKIIAGEIPSQVVHRDDSYVVFFDIEPKAALHLLICPIAHTNAFQQTPPEIIAGATSVIQNLAKKLNIENNYSLQINNGANAGQIVFHLHIHLLSSDKNANEKAKTLIL